MKRLAITFCMLSAVAVSAPAFAAGDCAGMASTTATSTTTTASTTPATPAKGG